MIAGIMTTPKRQDYLANLVSGITKYVDKLVIYSDVNYNGVEYNQARMYSELLSQAKPDEPVLLSDDDMELCDSWYDDFTKLHKELNANAYIMFNRHKHLHKPDNIAKGYAKGNFKNSFYTNTIIIVNMPNLIDDLYKWLDNGGRETIRPAYKIKHFDSVIQAYYLSTGKDYVVLTPSLANHKGIKSNLKHQIGVAYMYKGDYNLSEN